MPSLNDRLRVSSANLVWRDCDEGSLIYDEQSGKTSLLNHRGVSILKTLSANNGISEAELMLASSLEREFDTLEFRALVALLENSGLIVRC